MTLPDVCILSTRGVTIQEGLVPGEWTVDSMHHTQGIIYGWNLPDEYVYIGDARLPTRVFISNIPFFGYLISAISSVHLIRSSSYIFNLRRKYDAWLN